MHHRTRFEEHFGTPPEFLYLGERALEILKESCTEGVIISEADLIKGTLSRFYDMKIATISNDPDHLRVG